jgi:hypothetical protein
MELVNGPALKFILPILGVFVLNVNGARVARFKEVVKEKSGVPDTAALLEKFSEDFQNSEVNQEDASPEVRVSSGGFDGGEKFETGTAFPEMEELSRQMDDISMRMSEMSPSTGVAAAEEDVAQKQAAARSIEEMLGNMRSLVNSAADRFRGEMAKSTATHRPGATRIDETEIAAARTETHEDAKKVLGEVIAEPESTALQKWWTQPEEVQEEIVVPEIASKKEKPEATAKGQRKQKKRTSGAVQNIMGRIRNKQASF